MVPLILGNPHFSLGENGPAKHQYRSFLCLAHDWGVIIQTDSVLMQPEKHETWQVGDWASPLILKVLHGISILQYQYSQGVRCLAAGCFILTVTKAPPSPTLRDVEGIQS